MLAKFGPATKAADVVVSLTKGPLFGSVATNCYNRQRRALQTWQFFLSVLANSSFPNGVAILFLAFLNRLVLQTSSGQMSSCSEGIVIMARKFHCSSL